jgi:hypothetical protein
MYFTSTIAMGGCKKNRGGKDVLSRKKCVAKWGKIIF